MKVVFDQSGFDELVLYLFKHPVTVSLVIVPLCNGSPERNTRLARA